MNNNVQSRDCSRFKRAQFCKLIGSWWRFNLAGTGKQFSHFGDLISDQRRSRFQRRFSLSHFPWKTHSHVPPDFQLTTHMVSAPTSAARLSLSSAHQVPEAPGITLYSTQGLKLQASLTSSNGCSCGAVLLQQLRRWIYSRFPNFAPDITAGRRKM